MHVPELVHPQEAKSVRSMSRNPSRCRSIADNTLNRKDLVEVTAGPNTRAWSRSTALVRNLGPARAKGGVTQRHIDVQIHVIGPEEVLSSTLTWPARSRFTNVQEKSSVLLRLYVYPSTVHTFSDLFLQSLTLSRCRGVHLWSGASHETPPHTRDPRSCHCLRHA